MMGFMTNNTTLTAYSINVADSDTAPAWLALCATVAMGAQDSGRQRMTVTTAQPSALEAALAADDTVIEYAADTAPAETITAAQLFWDDQDPKAAGWWLRYTDAAGTEQGAAIDGTEDATTEELAAEVAASLSGMSGRVVVLRGEKRHGWVDVADGAVANWSAL